MHLLYQSLIRERVRYAIAAARAVQPLEHSGVKGAIREVLMADLFRPLLPADIGVATGILISAFDQQQSGQQDIIVFNKRILPPILFEQGPAIVPVESAMVSIEVKSKLTATELQTAHESAVRVRNLGRGPRRACIDPSAAAGSYTRSRIRNILPSKNEPR